MKFGLKRIRLKMAVVLSCVLTFFLLSQFYFPKFITEIRNPLIMKFRNQEPVPGYLDAEVPGQNISFLSHDDLRLSAFLASSTGKARGTIILLHGIRSNKECFISLSQLLAKAGYQTVALDLRAHGNSDGQYCSFGYHEKQDISSLIDHLEKEGLIEGKIGLWGRSLGAAVGLQAMSIDKRISYGIIESTFSNFSEITHDYAKRMLGFNLRPYTNHLIKRSAKMARFKADQASPELACKDIQQPVIIAHGTKDAHINFSYAKRNYQSLSSKNKQLIPIEGADHMNLWSVGGDAYFKRVLEFIRVNSR